MKILITESQKNALVESLTGNLYRLNPNIRKNDEKASKLFHDIIEDFDKHGQDFKKLHIRDYGGTEISLEKIMIGKFYNITYVFGEYHPIFGDVSVENRRTGDRRVEINKVPFFITLKRGSLEKAFNTPPIKLGVTGVKETNIKYDFSTQENKQFEDRYKISPDLANKLFKYFVKYWNYKYPEHKNVVYRGGHSVKDIERGIPPVIKKLEITTKDGKTVYYSLRKGENERELKRIISNMTIDEFDKFEKEKHTELYRPSSEKYDRERNELHDKIFSLLNKKFDVEEIRLTRFMPGYGFYLEFKHPKNINLKEQLENLFNNITIDRYKGELINVSDGWKESKHLFYTLQFTFQK